MKVYISHAFAKYILYLVNLLRKGFVLHGRYEFYKNKEIPISRLITDFI